MAPSNPGKKGGSRNTQKPSLNYTGNNLESEINDASNLSILSNRIDSENLDSYRNQVETSKVNKSIPLS